MDHITHTVAGDRCDIYFPETEQDLAGFFNFLAQGHALLGFDTEGTGLDLYSKTHQLRLVQIGSANEAWVLRVDRFKAAICHALRMDRQYVAHNAPFDCLAVDRHLGVVLEDLMPRVMDTRILGHLLDPRTKLEGGDGLRLKDLCAVHVDPAAPDTESALTAVFNSMRLTKQTGWARIPINHRAYVTYAGLDPILARRLFTPLSTRVYQAGLGDLSTFEHELQYLLATLQRKGMLLDVPYIERLKVDLLNEHDQFCDVAMDLGLDNVNSPQQVSAHLLAMGEELTERTKEGNIKVDRAVLSLLADLNRQWERIGAREPNPVADSVIRAKRAGKWAETYAQSFLDLRDPFDRLHSGINSLQARTGRMCLPESEMLLTRRGSLHVSEIMVGDETLDSMGAWVPVTAVHRYPAQEVVEYRSGRVGQGPAAKYSLHSTKEHRWLQRSPRGRVALEPITSARPTIILTPPQTFEFGTTFIADTEGERFASVVGLLATDGRLFSPTKIGEGMSALLYQTEKKFYNEIRDLVPEPWISYDRVTNKDDHHEIGIKVRTLRPLLAAVGLVPEPGCTLKQHPGLEAWVGTLPLNEVAAFFRAVYMADGSVSSGHKVIYCGEPLLARAIRFAAYRLGWLTSSLLAAPGGWSTGPRPYLSFRKGVMLLRDRVEVTSTADVWCVSTSTGTFTADGALGFYLTGNSISQPPLQQLPAGEWKVRRCFVPDPGQVMIAADFQAVEMRVLAAVAEEYTMQQAIASGLDLHSFTAERVFGPNFTKAHRQIAKAVGFGKVYGGGAETISRQTGADIPSVKQALIAYDRTFPGIRKYSYRLIDRMKNGLNEVTTPIGRRLPVDADRLYACTNYIVQSTARDLFAKAIVRIFKAGMGQYLLLPIHDELLGQAPVAEAEDVVKEIGRLMESTFMGVHIASSPKVVGSSWGAAYGAPENLSTEPLERVGRRKKPGTWDQEELDVFSLL